MNSSETQTAYQILIVDDEQPILDALQRELRSWAKGHNLEILTAGSGEEALKILENGEQRIAILLTDNRMPGISGAQLVRTVVEARNPVVPLLLTGYTEKHDIQAALSAGIFAFIVKPWDRKKLQDELDYALESYLLRLRTQHSSRRLREELRTAQEFHKILFRVQIPEDLNGYRLDHFQSTPSRFGVSGDYFDLITLNEHRYLLLIGDVAGHGLRATFVAAIIKSIVYSEYVRPRLDAEISPARLLEWLNERLGLITEEMPDLFVTFMAGVLDTSAETMTLAAAGSPFPVLIDRSNTPQELPVHGVALGVKKDNTYREHSTPFRAHETLYLFTDGVSPIGSGSDTRINHGFMNALREAGPYEDLKKLAGELRSICGAEVVEDDVTIVRLRSDGR